MPEILIHTLPECTGLPRLATPGSAGADLYAAKPSSARPWTLHSDAGCSVKITQCPPGGLVMAPRQRVTIPVGVCLALPVGFEGQIRPRSGLARRHGIGIVNAPGTIDSDYRGALAVVLVNHGGGPVTIEPGQRIAQLVIAPVARPSFVQVTLEEMGETKRGTGGFGSTGDK